MTAHIFIDGSAGTTGLQIQERLAARGDISLILLDAAEKKDPVRRGQALNDADVSILCLPDAAAKETVSLARANSVRIIDTSTAHRTDPDWVYGLAELKAGQADLISGAARVSNPGCYPTGVIVALNPLVAAGMVPADYPVAVSAVSGYTGGGKQMIAEYENTDGGAGDDSPPAAFHLYGLQLQHKHLAEMQVYGGLAKPPVFIPSVGNFPQGMITQVPLDLARLPGTPTVAHIHDTLAAFYAGSEVIELVSLSDAQTVKRLPGDMMAGSDKLKLYVFGDEAKQQVMIAAVFDNLGKGASGAAVQNLDLMLGARV
ncbi:N-acetyl-gamma-glutamyl-phosphate reductase [Sneathiella marina]|uniref:N-acetyl-gamma-glutamyl-phosphate reductase n=1 Tax=Sneathiella marina TaxID=2950108 RepID=A0ABY4W1W7_9PROT|nr:N-acetyl-gamma-glutamyl-phosphate reductase [Sneathiella marina]USG60098.1 N-acetyl-gamma-glutamyl-phosphate reductase [Sneathiella marina]